MEEKELVRSLRRDGMSLENAVLVTTHAPFIISGKYSDYKEGEMVSTTIEELYVHSLANKFEEDYVRIILNNKIFDYKLDGLTLEKDDRGTLKSLICGIFEQLIHRKYFTVFEGLEISVKSNIPGDNGLPLNLIANILLSLNSLYELKMTPSIMADITQEVYINYFGKTISYLNCMTLYHDGINRFELTKNVINIEHLDKKDDTFRYILFENGPRLKANHYNDFYASLFELFAKVKKICNINYLSDLDYSKDFGTLYSPYSELLEPEKLVFTHHMEDLKRAKVIFSVYKHQNNPRQLLDAVNMCTNELSAYCGFNNLNKFLETMVYNATFKVGSAVTTLNDETTNMFIFIMEKQFYEIVLRKLETYKNYIYYEVHPADEATTVTIINKSKDKK